MKARLFLFFTILSLSVSLNVISQGKYENPGYDKDKNAAMYSEMVSGIQIVKGAWRPMFESENVIWVKPPWPGKEYFWLDFPEAIWTDSRLFYLGHIDARFPAYYSNHLDSISWFEKAGSVHYERILSNGVRFGGSVTKQNDNEIAMEIWIENGSDMKLNKVFLQTCSFLYPLKEFNQMTNDNKVVHIGERGWISLSEALKEGTSRPEEGNYHAGWLGGPKIVDFPFIIATSGDGMHHIATSWLENTYSFVGNENHPCFHSDPFFPDISPGERKTIHGKIIFFNGSLEKFEDDLLRTYAK